MNSPFVEPPSSLRATKAAYRQDFVSCAALVCKAERCRVHRGFARSGPIVQVTRLSTHLLHRSVLHLPIVPPSNKPVLRCKAGGSKNRLGLRSRGSCAWACGRCRHLMPRNIPQFLSFPLASRDWQSSPLHRPRSPAANRCSTTLPFCLWIQAKQSLTRTGRPYRCLPTQIASSLLAGRS